MTNHLQQVVIDDVPAKLDILGEFIDKLVDVNCDVWSTH